MLSKYGQYLSCLSTHACITHLFVITAGRISLRSAQFHRYSQRIMRALLGSKHEGAVRDQTSRKLALLPVFSKRSFVTRVSACDCDISFERRQDIY
jgi:hypothetical protein